MALPQRTTMRGPNRSISMPQPKLVRPIARKLIVIAPEIAVRDHPVACVIGCRNTGSEKIEPIATQPMNAPAATITQRYDVFMRPSPRALKLSTAQSHDAGAAAETAASDCA